MGFRWPWSRPRAQIYVDFDQQPTLPQGTTRIVRHVPAARGLRMLRPGDMVLKSIPALQTYRDWYGEYGGAGCGDALILDAIFQNLVANGSNIRGAERTLHDFFGSFWGQIFFLGSGFAARDGGAECVTFLNVRTKHITGMPAIRYSCPAENPVRPDVPVTACFLSDSFLSR